MKLLQTLVFSILIFPLTVWSQSGSLEITANITFMAKDMGAILEHWQPGLRRVFPKDWISVPQQKVTLTQISETEVEVKLKKPFKFFLHSNGEVLVKTIERFVITGSIDSLDKMMSVEEGTYRTTIDSRRRNITKFIRTMMVDGINHRMANLFNGRAPLPIYKINSLDFSVRLSDLLYTGRARVFGVDYSIDVISNNRFSRPAHSRTVIGLKFLGREVDVNSGLVKSYLAAFQKIMERAALFQKRDWWKGLKVGSQTAEGLNLSQIENVEPIRMRCSAIFK